MYQVVTKAFNNDYNLEDINRTLIVLIPKLGNPEFINQFRLISLCNVIYKCISKIIVNHLKSFLPSWTSPLQASFVLGRSIQNNIIIAQEILHSTRRMNGRNAFMAIKIDLEKADDRVNYIGVLLPT